MFLLKLLVNLIPAAIVVGLFYSLFYFDVVPRLIGHYRKVMRRGKVYEEQIKNIKEENK